MCKNSNNWSSTDNWEVLIIGLCILLLLFGVATFVIKQWWLTPEPQIIEVVIAPQDSICTSYVYDRESLDLLVSNINARISDNEAKYESLLDTHEDERIKSLASLLIGIISSIALFFGYKSFRDIREKGEETSKTVAEDTANQTAKKAAEEYLNSKLPDIVKDELNKGLYKKEVIDSTKASIIAQIKPELLRELADEKKSDDDEHENTNTKGKALDYNEMFGASPSTIDSVAEESAAKEQKKLDGQNETSVKTTNPTADGKD